MRTLDRYIIQEVLPPAIVALLTFTFVLEIQPLTSIAESLIRHGASGTVMLHIVALTVPQALALTIPMALVCGILVAFGRLSADSEYRALQACGISIVGLLRPILLLAAIFSAASAYIGFEVAPGAATAFRELTFRTLSAASGQIPSLVFVDAFPNRTIFYRDSFDGVWRDVFIADTSDPQLPAVYVAREGRLQIDRDSRTLRIVLNDGTRHVPPQPDRNVYERTRFERSDVNLDWDVVFPPSTVMRTAGELTLAELRTAIADGRRRGRRTASLEVELHRRFVVPAACVILAVLSLGVGATVTKTGKFGAFFVGILIVFASYVMMFTGRAMVMAGRLPAPLGMWYSNAVLALVAIALIVWRTGRTTALRLESRATPKFVETLERYRRSIVRVGTGWRTLDRYVLRLYAAVWALMFVSLAVISYASVFTDLLTDLLQSSKSAWLVVPFLAYDLPIITYYVIPVATLMSGLVTMGLLAKNSELTAMKACGISLYRVGAPLLLASAVIGATLFVIQERVMPESTRTAEAIRDEIRGRPVSSFRKLSRAWIRGRDGTIYHVDHIDAARGEIRGLDLFEFAPDEWRVTRRITARTATIDPGSDTAAEWTVSDGTIWTFTAAGISAGVPFSRARLRFEPIPYFKLDQPEADRMSYFELSTYIGDLRAGGTNVAPYVVALERKRSFPFVTVVMTLLAVPFGITAGRRGAVHGIGIGALLAFTYWTMMSAFGALGGAGALVPVLAAWAPNVLFSLGAIFLILTVRT